MKKVLAVAMIAILAASTVFAAFTGSANVDFVGYNFEDGSYGFVNGTNVKFDVELASASAEKIAEGDVYASIKASLSLKFDNGKDGTAVGDFPVPTDLKVTTKIEEAKVAGADWYVSILGSGAGNDFAKSAIDTYKDGDDDKAVTVTPAYGEIPGVEGAYKDYVVGFGLTGNAEKDEFNVNAYTKTPEFKLADAITLQVGAQAQRLQSKGAQAGASVAVGYADDTITTKLASDVAVDVKNVGDKAKATANVDVAYSLSIAPVTLDAYYALRAEKVGDPAKSVDNLLSVKVATDLNAFEIPVKVTATGKDLVNTQDLKLEAEATVVEGVTVNGNVGYVIGTKKLSTGVGAKYVADVFTVEGGVAYGVTVGTEKSNVLSANASVSTTALIPGAELKLSYGKASKDMNFLANQTAAAAQNFGKVVATCKIEF